MFWNKAHDTVKWKLQVLEAILKSKVLYGSECVQLTSSDPDKITAFQMKSLRRILKIPPTFIDRTYTDHKVNHILRDDHHIQVEMFTTTWMNKKIKLLGHILRADTNDPMRQVMFESTTSLPRITLARPGRPRAAWSQ